jgi:acyl carrier protein
MTPHRSEAKLRAVVAEATSRDVSALGLEEDLIEALDLDSLAGLRVLAAIETRFAVRFPDELLSELRTLGRLLDALDAAPKGDAS